MGSKLIGADTNPCYLGFPFDLYGVSSSSHGGGAREQRALGVAVARLRLAVGAGGRRARASHAAAQPPAQHRAPKRPERLRGTGPLTAPTPCNNISAHRYTHATLYSTHGLSSPLTSSTALRHNRLTSLATVCRHTLPKESQCARGLGRRVRALFRHYHNANIVVSRIR
ncbi:hypothetical protein RR46_05134 [Papilio xuthus]|uniref:Uncharacterized protein n=1 Tax=Papilio xuthus TaxID=66420 RepID=A0A194QAA0_PAPXU|nr:hypothetical protein RR46_05134 [Papilio xuthus]